MTYRELVRKRLRQELRASFPDERSDEHREVMDALRRQHAQIERMARRIESRSWLTDFGSDVAANIFTDTLWWVGRQLIRR